MFFRSSRAGSIPGGEAGRNRMKPEIPALVCFVLLWPAVGATAPSQLYGKTIIITANEVRTFRPVGESETRTLNYGIRWSIYVSEAGRLFVRSDRSAGGRSKAIDTAPGGKLGVSVASATQFSGNTMIVTQQFSSGANRITVTFDPSFASCTATHLSGHEGNKPTVLHGRFIGQNIEILASSISITGCSVQTGNVFAH
jgi:hypothetical protein